MLSDILQQDVAAVDIMRHDSRPYSEIWFLNLDLAGHQSGVVAKGWASPDAFDKQVRMLQWAGRINAGIDGARIPYLGACRRERVLFMQEVRDPPVARLCRLPLRDACTARGRRRWLANLEAACHAAGVWLRRWHAMAREREPLAPLLRAYLATRDDCLEAIGTRQRDALLALVDSLGEGSTCVPHGDFTPYNVLWSPGTLTLLDFGISEWDRMTPCWDYVVMQLGLTRILGFGSRNPASWSSRASRGAVGAFARGYGDVGEDAQVRWVCAAIRHLVFYAGERQRGRSYQRRSAWHRRRFDAVLAQAAAAAGE